jgi:hypothetical protein
MKPILEIRGANGRAMAEIGDQYGFRIVVIKEPAVYSALKVSEQLFKESRTCDPSVRAAWPNVGGASWIR